MHFVNCGLEQWLVKYAVMGAFPDYWCHPQRCVVIYLPLNRLFFRLGDETKKIPFAFHIESRNAVSESNATGNAAVAEGLYRRVVVYDDQAEVRRLALLNA